jgi:hypothetical protein
VTVTKLDLKVTADATAAVRGLKPLSTSLTEVAKTADKTESALQDLDKAHTIKVNDKAIDNARREITRLRGEMRRKLSVDATADTRAAERRIRQLQSSIRTLDRQDPTISVHADTARAESSLRSLGSSVKGLLGAAAALQAGKGLFAAALGADQYANNLKGLSVVVGDIVAQDLTEWVEENGDALNLSQTAAIEAGRSFSVYAKQVQDAGGDASEFTTDLINLSAELAAFSGADPAEVITALGSALRGEFDPLERFNIQLTAAQVEAKALELGLIGVGEEMSSQAKTQASYALLLERGAFAMGSVERNADSLTGKIADLRQKSSDAAKVVGDDLAPGLSDAADAASFLAEKIGLLATRWAEFREGARGASADGKNTFDDFKELFSSNAFEQPRIWRDHLFPFWAGDAEEVETNVAGVGDATAAAGIQAQQAAGKVAAFAASTSGLEQSAEDARKFEQALSDALDSIGRIGANVRTRLNFIIDQDDLTEEINNAIRGNKEDEVKPVRLPVDVDVSDLAKLKDPQQQLLVSMGQLWANSLERGMELEQLNPDFNLQGFLNEQSANLDPLLLKAGIAPGNIEEVKAQILGADPTVIARVVADTKQAQIDMGLIPPPPPIKVPVLPEWLPVPNAASANMGAGQAVTITPTVLPPVFPVIVPPSVVITPSANTAPADTALDGVAGKDRNSWIDALMGTDAASSSLDYITRDRYVTVHVNEVTTSTTAPGGPGAGGQSIVPQLLGGTAALAGVRTAALATPRVVLAAAAPGDSQRATRNRGTVTQLAPRQTPIKVYLDGAEIADHLTVKASRVASASTVRRRA